MTKQPFRPTYADLVYIFDGPVSYGREWADGETEVFDSKGQYVGTRNRGTGVFTMAPFED